MEAKNLTNSSSGPSKAGKSWLLINLGLSIAAGREWLGHKCKASKVLALDLELKSASYQKRISIVAEKLGIDLDTIEGQLLPVAFRGHQIKDVFQSIESYLKQTSPDVILIDPIYKILEGDENSNSEIASFCNKLDHLAVKYDCSIIYVHHHSKGDKTGVAAIDKQSGAGTFGRFPDTILSFTQQRVSGELIENKYILEYVLREFKNPSEKLVSFDYPIHNVESDDPKSEIQQHFEHITQMITHRDIKFKELKTLKNWSNDQVDEILEALENLGINVENGLIRKWVKQ